MALIVFEREEDWSSVGEKRKQNANLLILLKIRFLLRMLTIESYRLFRLLLLKDILGKSAK